MPTSLKNLTVARGLEKISLHPNPKEGQCQRMLQLPYNCKVMLKILQGRLQQYVDLELPEVQAGFRRGRGTRDQTANMRWIIKKAREFQKTTSTSASLTTQKPLTVWTTANYGKFLKKLECLTTLHLLKLDCLPHFSGLLP